eukprot:gene1691-1845_t
MVWNSQASSKLPYKSTVSNFMGEPTSINYGAKKLVPGCGTGSHGRPDINLTQELNVNLRSDEMVELRFHHSTLHPVNQTNSNKQRRKKSSKKDGTLSAVFDYCSRAFGSNKVNPASSSKSKVRSGKSFDVAGNSMSVPR